MNVVMREVQSWAELEDLTKNQGGEYMLVTRSETDPRKATHGDKFPIVVCPRCKRPGSCSDHTLVKGSPLTIRASYLCGQNKFWPDGTQGTCGFHAMITDGVMVEC